VPLDAFAATRKAAASAGVVSRRINRARPLMAIVQIRHDTEDHVYYRHRVAAHKPPQQRV
jgi:hypothetical protein